MLDANSKTNLSLSSARNIWVLSLFPDFIKSFFDLGVVGKGLRGERGQEINFNIVNIRDYSLNRYKSVDSPPYGGGPGMIMRADVLKNAFVEGVLKNYNLDSSDPGAWRKRLLVALTSPRGTTWNQETAKGIVQNWYDNTRTPRDLVIICGRYEGIDERFITHYVEQEWSIGDFILSGGELAALTILDSVLRLIPGFLGNTKALETESFEDGLLEAPQFTRPREFDGLSVPEVLLSGDHKKIQEFNAQQRVSITKRFRADLMGIEENKDV